MNALHILRRRLSGKSKLFLAVYLLMTLGFLTFLTSPFLLIWVSWSLAWRVGATGLAVTIICLIGWWFLYNSFFQTFNAIDYEHKTR